MRILFSIILLTFVIIPHNGIAATCDGLSAESCTTTAGCGWDDVGGCKACSALQYSSTTDSKCKACTNKPSSNGTFEYGTKTNNESNTCSWTGRCNENYYWNGNACTPCAKYYHSSSQPTISFSGGTATLPSESNTCTGNVYEITLEKNLTNFLESPKTVWVKYGSGFADSANASSWRTDPAKTPSYKWWQEFNGYSDSTNSRTLWLDSEGKLTNSKTNTSFTENKTLYGQWKGKNFEIIYYNPDGQTENRRQTCSTESNSENYTTCTVEEFDRNNGNLSGNYLANWKCTQGCTKSTLQPGEIFSISESAISTGVILVAQTEQCPTGYYCTSTSKEACPKGTTSSKGAKQKSDCIIKSDNNKTYSSSTECAEKSDGTCFCDNNGCFTLPGITEYSAN